MSQYREPKKPILVITGPTACGKTETAIELAKVLEGEIISADSMQVYQEMNLGTAKPNEAEKQGIPHHIMDLVPPDFPFSVADFTKLGHEHINAIENKNKVPIICGGTGFYINALIKNTQFHETSSDFTLRKELHDFAKAKGNMALHETLKAFDVDSYEKIHPNNVKRVIRAIEYFKQTAMTISSHNQREKEKPLYYKTVVVKLFMERTALYERINQRAERMLESGLIEEVAALLKKYDPHLTSMEGIGYKEIVAYHQGLYSKKAALAAMQQHTRHLAKRQISWSENQMPGEKDAFFRYTPGNNPVILRDKILAYYNRFDKTSL